MRLRSFFVAIAMGAGVVAPVITAGPASAKEKFCLDVTAIKKQSKLMGTLAEPKAIAKAAAEFATTMKRSESRSPGALRADWQKMSQGMAKVSGLMKRMANLNAAQTVKDLPKLQADMVKITEDKAYSVSGAKVTAWAKKNCGIDMNA